MTHLDVAGFKIYPGFLNLEQQQQIVSDLRAIVQKAPHFRPTTPQGRTMSVRITSAGRCGWISDSAGYRYQNQHPTGVPWPPIPTGILNIWHSLTDLDRRPDSMLINYYQANARMGLHQDKDEADFRWPVMSISLGDDALFRMGGPQRTDKTQSHWLRSGDIVIMAGPARLAFHGVDRIRAGSSSLLAQGGRLNLTLRCAA
jgi:alkylated DNA repair protein (DNA oxidative demethylase)